MMTLFLRQQSIMTELQLPLKPKGETLEEGYLKFTKREMKSSGKWQRIKKPVSNNRTVDHDLQFSKRTSQMCPFLKRYTAKKQNWLVHLYGQLILHHICKMSNVEYTFSRRTFRIIKGARKDEELTFEKWHSRES